MSTAAPTVDEKQQAPDPAAAAMRDEWIAAVSALADQVEGWCRSRDWPVKRNWKPVKWDPLGPYEAERLLFHTGDRQYLLVTRGRMAENSAEGSVDLGILPEYDTILLAWREGSWHARFPDSPPKGSPVLWVPWDESRFMQILEELERTADGPGGW